MSIEEVRALYSLVGGFSIGALFAGGLIFLFGKYYLSSYLNEKAKNLATHEDIAEITERIERVRSQYSSLAEELKARHQLRMAAVDRRLQAHQEAFTHWRELLNSTHREGTGKAVLKCQAWWEQNCVYLEPIVREAFLEAYSTAQMHQALVQGGADSKSIGDSWKQIMKFPNVLFEAVQLPALSELEVKALKDQHSAARRQDG